MKLRNALKEYNERLLRGPVSVRETARIHVLRLETDCDLESRLRSLQVLGELSYPGFVPLALRELTRTVEDWPAAGTNERVDVLVGLLARFMRVGTDREVHQFLYLASHGVATRDMRLPRSVALRIYLSEEDGRGIERLLHTVERFAGSLGFELAAYLPAAPGSWFKQLFARTSEALTHEEVQARLRKGERALELVALHERQASVDRDLAEAAERLVSSLDEVPEGVCQLGSLLVVKLERDDGQSRLIIKQLTQHQLIELENDPGLLDSPREILLRVAGVLPEGSDDP